MVATADSLYEPDLSVDLFLSGIVVPHYKREFFSGAIQAVCSAASCDMGDHANYDADTLLSR